jgi:N-acetylglucosamine-6-phosphate deacetylase
MTPSPRLPTCFAGPGLIDLQLNGYAGFDFNSPPERWIPEDFLGVGHALQRRGVMAALPTFITDSDERLIARARTYAHVLDEAPELTTVFPRLHIEGPFVSSEEGPRGAHPEAHCRTPRELPDLFERLCEASGDRIGILSLAPELPGALELISAAAERGVCVALAHTHASPEVLGAAVAAGAKLSTHLGNGSHLLLPRHENYIQVQLAEDRLFASFIADGHHLPWYTLKNFIRAKGPERSVLVTDAIAAADVGPGLYFLGDGEVLVSPDLRAQRPGQPGLAGSALTLDHAIINVVTHCDVPFEKAWEMASTRAAALVGLKVPADISVQLSEAGFNAVRRPTTPATAHQRL